MKTVLTVGLVVAALASSAGAAQFSAPADAPSVELDAPYVPTAEPIVKSMLTMGGVGPNDIVYDLGSGDGRLPIAAVKEFGAKKGVGIDLDPVRVTEAKANARKAGVEDRVTFHQGDMFEFDFSEATLLPLYLLPEMMLKLRPKMLDMKPGTRIVAHDYALGDWKADKFESHGSSTLYFWVVPAKVNGTWKWRMNGKDYSADIAQTYQQVAGSVQADAVKASMDIPVLVGDSLTFEARLPGPSGTQPLAFEGKVNGDSIEATVVLAGRTAKVVAKRTAK
ncbi:MAG: methyltransferase domain-containing protein [Rhodospirillaceae bacterium]|nr:methyltransferase domain-containing protein [Rhodospirillaceae bacterium]